MLNIGPAAPAFQPLINLLTGQAWKNGRSNVEFPLISFDFVLWPTSVSANKQLRTTKVCQSHQCLLLFYFRCSRQWRNTAWSILHPRIAIHRYMYCVYLHICTCIYIYIFIYLYIYIYLFMYLFKKNNLFIYIHTHICICTVCVYVMICVWCIYIYTSLSLSIALSRSSLHM